MRRRWRLRWGKPAAVPGREEWMMDRQRKRVVAFGEAMVRLTPPRNERIERTRSLDLSPGGAELNTGVTLVCLGYHVAYVTKLPDNPVGRYLVRCARESGVDTSYVQLAAESEGRCGLYFLEEGTDPRPSAVVYDRADSAIARIEPGAFDWPAVLAGAHAFHLSGITLAVSEGCRAEAFAAVRAANAASVPVFFDLNYRSKLWTEAEAQTAFVEIVPLVDVMFASRGNLRTFFGIEGYHEAVLREAIERLGLAACVLSRKRAKASRGLRLAAIAMGRDGVLVDAGWKEIEVVDRLGGGDAFAGGFIAGYLEQPDDLTLATNLGLAASALKHTMPGDFLCATRAEIEAAMTTTAGGVLQR
jgi:2-dehydro-3-deoxygluconokinase